MASSLSAMPLVLRLSFTTILPMADDAATNVNGASVSPDDDATNVNGASVSPDRFDKDWLSSESLFASLSMVNRTSEPDSLPDIV